ncbi:MAG: hypothetical protein LBP41_02360 [Holosporaceae bacterium]|jgi:hypothetical protein|nr:hypothetical protein [Holosporaceae bacterium]
MKKTIASVVLFGMMFMNACTYCMIAESGKWEPVHAKRTIQDARPFTEYITEADAEGERYGQLLRIIGCENFKDNPDENFDANYQTALSITKELQNDDKYKLLGLCWCNATDELTGDESWRYGSDGKFPSPTLKEIWHGYHEIRYGECESSAEWASDVLYSAAFRANETIIPVSWKREYLYYLSSVLKKNYGKERNYEFRYKRVHVMSGPVREMRKKK